MSDMIPYQADPYRQGSAGGQDYLSAQGYPFPDGTGLPGGQAGYYSADYLSGWSDPYLASPGSQGIPYPGVAPQMYGQPYSQQHPYPQAPHGPYTPYGQGSYWGGAYNPRHYEANALGGWALGLGIASVFLFCYFGVLLGVPAIIVGFKGMRAADEGRSTNRGMSIAGMILGSIGTAISVIYITSFLILYLSTV